MNTRRFPPVHGRSRLLVLLLTVVVSGACAANTGLPAPRSLINSTGARLMADEARMEEIDAWVQKQTMDITNDPSFMIISMPTDVDVYMWDGLTIEGDTAEIQRRRTASDARVPYEFYAHFYLMQKDDRLEEYLPEGVGLEGYELERAILKRIADSWFYGRSIFDMTPYPLLDELMYASENGFLDAYILTARADEFPDERRKWLDENPGRAEEYRRWFMETFETEPPGIR